MEIRSVCHALTLPLILCGRHSQQSPPHLYINGNTWCVPHADPTPTFQFLAGDIHERVLLTYKFTEMCSACHTLIPILNPVRKTSAKKSSLSTY